MSEKSKEKLINSANQNQAHFNINDFSMRELQTFLLILRYEGKSLSDIKSYIDHEFNYKSRTKAYDYIAQLEKKGYIYKRKGRKVFVKKEIRRQFERLLIPTLGNIKEAYKDMLNHYLEEIRDVDKIREKFIDYTESLKISIMEIVKQAPIKEKEGKSLQKKILREFENGLKVELVKYHIFLE